MANALKEGLVAHYPLQSNAVNMVDGVAGTIKGTPSWCKNHAGKVVLNDTTAYVTHASHAINTVTYWKDGRFYAVLNGVPYMIDEALSSSFTSCANATMIGCNKLPEHLWYPSAENLYFDGSGYTLLDTGTAVTKYNLVGYNGAGSPASRTTLTVEGGITVPAINYNYPTNSYFFRGTTNWYNKLRGDYYEALLYSTTVASEWSTMWTVGSLTYNGGGTGGPGYGVYNNTGYIQSGIEGSFWPSHAATYSTGGRLSGLLYGTGSYASSFISGTVKASSFSNNASSSFPMTIGGLYGLSGAAGWGYTNKPIGPLAFYRNIFPTVSHATFIARRLARVQNGTWQPYIPLEDLV